MQRIIWTILLVIMLAPIAEADDAIKHCKESYSSMPRRLLNHIPAVVLNAKDRGRDVYRHDNAALIAEKKDDCTVSYIYYYQGEKNPPTCTETVSLCSAQGTESIASSQASPVVDSAITQLNNAETRADEKRRILEVPSEKERQNELRRRFENGEDEEKIYSVNIIIKKNGDKAAVLQDVIDLGGKMTDDESRFSSIRVITIEINRSQIKELVKRLRVNPNVDFFGKNSTTHIDSILITPLDQYFSIEYWAQKIGMPNAWGISTGGSGVITAVLDTGLDSWNDLTPNIVPGWNFIFGNSNTNDIGTSKHGTMVTSVLASTGSAPGTFTTDGLAGMSWSGSIMPIVIANSNGNGTTKGIADGINYAVTHGARVINISSSTTSDDPILSAAVVNAHNKGVIIVASAGNEGMNSHRYPAAYSTVIGVGGTNSTGVVDLRWSGSNYGSWVKVAAPADQIPVYSNGSYGTTAGTSFAAPQVAGLAALIIATNPALTESQIIENITFNTTFVAKEGVIPAVLFGRIQPYNALSQALQAARKDGDLDGDGYLAIADTLLSLQTVVGLRPLTESYLRHGDVYPYNLIYTSYNGPYPIDYIVPYGDGTMSISDSLLSLQATVGSVVWPGILTASPPPPAVFKSSITLSGTMPTNASVSLAGASGTSVGQIVYTGQNTWSCTVSNLTAGDNVFTVTGVDASGSTQLDTALVNFVPAQTIAAGSYHTISLKKDGTAWAWGSNNYSQLGNGKTTNSSTPVQVTGLSGLATVSAGLGHTMALKGDGTVWSWGSNNYGQLGNGKSTGGSYIPVQASGLTGVNAIAAGSSHSLALLENGTIQAWGLNSSGQLGRGIYTNSSVPVQVVALSGVKAIGCGSKHSVALLTDGTVWAWGDNSSGQLGNGTTVTSNIPVQVIGLTGVKAIAVGLGHTVALKGDGSVWTWGGNYYGQLGTGYTANMLNPVKISDLNSVTSVGAGGYHTLAMKSDGTVWSWGSNGLGQLGDGTTSDRLLPVQVNNVTGVVAIVAGYQHSAAMKIDGTVWSWGNNSYGQLGVSTVTQSALPVQTNSFDADDIVPPQTTANPSGGNYDATQTVTLSINEQATTYYTLDGTIPTYPVSGTTQIYSNLINITVNTVLNYFSRDLAGNMESVQTQSYNIATQGGGGTVTVPALSPYALAGIIAVLAGLIRRQQYI